MPNRKRKERSPGRQAAVGESVGKDTFLFCFLYKLSHISVDLPDSGLYSALEDLCTLQQQYLNHEAYASLKEVNLKTFFCIAKLETKVLSQDDEILRVDEFERELLALPADVGFSVAYHRLYPRLVQAHFNVRRMQESKNSNFLSHQLEVKRENVSEHVWELSNSAEGQRMQKQLSNDHFLNEFMVRIFLNLFSQRTDNSILF